MRPIRRQAVGRVGASLLRTILLIGIAYVVLAPLLNKFSTSITPVEELYDQSVKWIPRAPTFEYYRQVWTYMKYPRAAASTFGLTLIVSLLSVTSCSLVGYGLARFRWRFTGVLFGLVLFTLVVPPQLIATPLYLSFRRYTIYGLLPGDGLNLLGTIWPFVLTCGLGVGYKNGLYIYIMRQFFKSMPRELEEAAYIDGAGLLQTFSYVMLRGALPGMIVVFLFAFVWQWNDYFFVTLYMAGRQFLPQALEGVAGQVVRAAEGDTIAVQSQLLNGQFQSIINNAGMIMVIAPLVLIYIVLQRYFVEGVERTGLIG